MIHLPGRGPIRRRCAIEPVIVTTVVLCSPPEGTPGSWKAGPGQTLGAARLPTCVWKDRPLPSAHIVPKLPQDDIFHLIRSHVGWFGFRNDDRVLIVQIGVAIAGNRTTGNNSGRSPAHRERSGL